MAIENPLRSVAGFTILSGEVLRGIQKITFKLII